MKLKGRRQSKNLEDRRGERDASFEKMDVSREKDRTDYELDELMNDTYQFHPTSIIDVLLENQVPFFSPAPLTNIRTLQETQPPQSILRKQSRLKQRS